MKRNAPVRGLLSAALLTALLSSCATGWDSSDTPPTSGTTNPPGGSWGIGVRPDYQPPSGDPAWTINHATIGLTAAHKIANGDGVLVGTVSNGPEFTGYAPIRGKEAPGGAKVWNGDKETTNGMEPGLATAVATVIAGNPWNAFQGGVAPGARILWTPTNNAANLRLMADRGMSVLNLPFGYYSRIGDLDPDVARRIMTDDGMYRFFSDFRRSGGIVIGSTGMTGKDAPPGILPGAPYYFPELTNQLIVTGLDDLNSKLADWSTPCGVTKDFCLTAPGTWRLLWPYEGRPDTFSFRWVDGQMAQATVAGIAALVKQKYPWMDGTQIAKTLLTTAKDIGAKGVDDVYGWGLVNAEKALLGPAQINGAWNAAIPLGMTSTFENDISGNGTLTINGLGTLALAGNTSFGDALVNSGGLALNGNFGGTVHQHSGTVSGTGTIRGDLLQSGGRLSLSSSAPMAVTGNAHLDGTVSLTPGQGFTGRSSGTFLTAGNLDGNWTADRNSMFHSFSVQQTGNSLTGTVTRSSGLTTLQTAGLGDGATQIAASGIDGMLSQSDRNGGSGTNQAMLDAVNRLDISNEATLALDSASGQAHATARGAAIATARGQQRWLLDRARVAADSENGGAWVMAGGQENQIRDPNGLDYDLSSRSLIAGLDRRFTPSISAGVALQRGTVNSEFDRLGGKVRTQQSGASAYMTWKPAERTRVTGTIGASKLDNDINRVIALGQPASTAATTGATLISAGIRAEQGLTDHLSLVGEIQHDRLTSKAFREMDANGFELVAERSTNTDSRAGIGILLHDGKPVGRVGWTWNGEIMSVHGIAGGDLGFDASFAGAQGTNFRIEGMDPGKHSAWISGTLGYRFGKGVLGATLTGSQNRGGTNTQASVFWRSEF